MRQSASSVINDAGQLYIGQGDLDARVSANHHKADCVKSKKATHVHAHLNEKKEDRESEEADLLDNYPEAFEPVGCNEKQES